MAQDLIDYGKLVDDAMHIIVYKVMKIIENRGLPGSHHFFISFITKFPGVKISKSLMNKYPREMTVVLQYQFQDLKVEQKGFSVSLSFGGNRENIYIPFAAITTFADPSVQFGLQFRETDHDYQDEIEFDSDSIEYEEKQVLKSNGKKTSKKVVNNVVSLDQFRKNNK